MSLSKTLSSTIAAVTIAGAVGFAYAQTTSNDSGKVPAPTSADTSQPMSNTAPATSTPSTTTTTPMPSSTTTTTTTTDATVAPSPALAPKADRN